MGFCVPKNLIFLALHKSTIDNEDGGQRQNTHTHTNTHTPNFIISSQDFHIELVKKCGQLEKILKYLTFKPESSQNRRFKEQELSSGTYAL